MPKTAALPNQGALANAARRLNHGPNFQFQKFDKLSNPNTRHVILDELGMAPFRHVTVICHKDSFNNPNMRKRHGKMYFYASHLLLERISWVCRDAHASNPSYDGKPFIIFSHRASLRYDAFQEYSKDIKSERGPIHSNADWSHLDLAAIKAIPHSSGCKGLLAADYVVSSFGKALEPNLHGLTDDRPVRALRRNVYRYKGRSFANGVKIFPPEAEPILRKDPRFWWYEPFFEKMGRA